MFEVLFFKILICKVWLKSEIQKPAVLTHVEFQNEMAARLALDTAGPKSPATGGSRKTRGGGHRVGVVLQGCVRSQFFMIWI